MADYDRDRSRYDEDRDRRFRRSRFDEEDNRGAFGYEGEGYLRREDVCQRLVQDERVDATDIEVRVKEGIATLSGSVDDRTSKRRSEDIVESVRGVKDVQNQIRVSREIS
jgi:osmotically-inducible protein OsmY